MKHQGGACSAEYQDVFS